MMDEERLERIQIESDRIDRIRDHVPVEEFDPVQAQIAARQPFFKTPTPPKRRGPNGFPIGPRTERRQKENAKLNKLGIKHCEIGIQGICAKRGASWAHSKKSRFLTTSADWQDAARSCIPCHDKIEAMSHAEMKRVVCEAIKRRKG